MRIEKVVLWRETNNVRGVDSLVSLVLNLRWCLRQHAQYCMFDSVAISLFNLLS